MVPRNAVPSKPDTSERRERAFVWIQASCESFFAPIIAFGLACCDFHAYAALNVWAMGYADGKSTGQALTCPIAAGLSCRGRI